MKSTTKLLYSSARKKRKAGQKLRFPPFTAEIFFLRKQVHMKQLDQPEAKMPSDKCLFQLQGKMAFGKHLNYGALNHQRTTPPLVQVRNYTGTHRSMVCDCVPTVGILLSPWQSQQLKCWFDAWHFNIATLPETRPTLAIVFEFSKRRLIIWPKSLFPE